MFMLLFSIVFARECDPFTSRKMKRNNCNTINKYNLYINNFFDNCANISNINTIYTNCKSKIYNIKHTSSIEHELEMLFPECLYTLSLEESIYNAGALSTFVSFVSKPFLKTILAPTFSIYKANNLLYVGMDKIGHFFEEGYKCYGKTHKECSQFSKHTENTYYGLLSSGIYSYADIYANLKGLDFWNDLSTKYYNCTLTCIKLREIDLNYYLDEYFDESINPSRTILPWVKIPNPVMKPKIPFDILYIEGINPKLL